MEKIMEDDYIDLLAETLNPDPEFKVESPSQLFSQALMHGWDSAQPIEAAFSQVKRIGEALNLNPRLISLALEYTKTRYKYLTEHGGNSPETQLPILNTYVRDGVAYNNETNEEVPEITDQLKIVPHPEGSDRGGYIPTITLPNGTWYFNETDGSWQQMS
jgi:hypothetical protein